MIILVYISLSLVSTSVVWAKNSCIENLKPKLSSMLYLWVDNGGKEKLSPIYERMVRDIQPGGVLVGASESIQKLETLRKLSSRVSKLYPKHNPPFLGADFIDIKSPGAQQPLHFGLGVEDAEVIQRATCLFW